MQTTKSKTVRTTVRLPHSVDRKIRQYAKAHNMTYTAVLAAGALEVTQKPPKKLPKLKLPVCPHSIHGKGPAVDINDNSAVLEFLDQNDEREVFNRR